MEITMGRPPIGKTAMTGAERVRRYRRALQKELAAAKARSAELARRRKPAAAESTDAIKRRIAEVEQERDSALAERAELSKMLDAGHRVIAQAKAILAAKGIMPPEIFKTVLHSAHPERKAKRAAAKRAKANPPKPLGRGREPDWEALDQIYRHELAWRLPKVES
jgi:chemotaxis protein histidine kinase CheA